MLERERHRLILKLVEERAVVGVAELTDLLDASEATIRRDIIALADRGELKRVRGGAEALRPRHTPHLVGVPFSVNLEVAVPEKRAIAETDRATTGALCVCAPACEHRSLRGPPCSTSPRHNP